MKINIPELISNYLNIPINDVKDRVKSFSLSELSGLIQAIRSDNREEAFKIYSGSAV